jgi:inositol transport system substrate-binding protein
MKRIIALLTVLSILVILVACGSETPAGGDNQNSKPVDKTNNEDKTDNNDGKVIGDINNDGKIVVGYLAKNTVDAFHSILNNTAKKHLDALVDDGTIDDWKMLDGLSDPIVQSNLLEDAINMGADAIILLPAEATGSAPILERCKEENIPCIVVNSKTDNTDELASAFVGSNDVQAGEMMAEFVKSIYPDGGAYAHIQGVIGNSAQIERSMGISNILDGDPDWELLDRQSGEWQAEKGVRFAEDWLTRFGDKLNSIICEDDGTSAAVQNAVNSQGREDIVCIGVNGEAMALDMIQKGEMLATIYQDGAGQAAKGVELTAEIIKGNQVEKVNMIDFVLITKDNVADYIN